MSKIVPNKIPSASARTFSPAAMIMFLVLCLGAGRSTGQTAVPAAKGVFVHPGIAHNQAELDFIKAGIQVGDEPWKTAWVGLQSSKYASLLWTPRPRANVERGAYNNPDIGGNDFMDDGSAAYTHALYWALSGELSHAQKTVEILNAWSGTLKSIGNHDAKLLVGMAGHQYCNAAELLRHSGAGWPQADQDRLQSMLLNVLYPVIQDFFPAANGNWDASMIQTMMAIGIFCDRQDIFKKAVEYFYNGPGKGALRNYVYESGQCQESTRDQAHTQMGLGYLAAACETGWKQGLNMWGALDDRLAVGFEYTAKYNLGYEVPCEGKISAQARGRFGPIYEKVYNHYHNRRGLEMPYTKMVVDKRRPERGGRESLPWGSLMYADLSIASSSAASHPPVPPEGNP